MFTANRKRHFHTTLIAGPLCLLSLAIVFDFFGMITGWYSFDTAAYWMASIGLFGIITATLFVAAEYVLLPSRSRYKGMALLHLLANLLMTILYTGSLLARGEDASNPQIMAVVFSMMGAGAGLVGGWLGGELVDPADAREVNEAPIELNLAGR